MVDVAPEHLEVIRSILAQYAPDCEIRVFGSRVNGRASKYSDLDLVLVGARKKDWKELEKIKEAFSMSDLPFTVDVLDWNDTAQGIRDAIEARYEVILKPSI